MSDGLSEGIVEGLQVCDERARRMNNDARSAVAENLHVVTVTAADNQRAFALVRRRRTSVPDRRASSCDCAVRLAGERKHGAESKADLAALPVPSENVRRGS